MNDQYQNGRNIFGREKPDSAAAREELRKFRLTPIQYTVGLFVIFAAAYSQYFINIPGIVSGFAYVYVLPIVATLLIPWSRKMIRRFFVNTAHAVWVGIVSFSAWSLVGYILSALVFYALLYFNPSSLNLLSRPNPVVNVPPQFALVMIGASILFVGPFEEYIFRGFVFGGLLSILHRRHWIFLAVLSSLLFASAHLYYGVVYQAASLTIFVDLFAFGMGMSFIYYFSGGNLFIPAVLHGLYDAAGFASVVLSSSYEVNLKLGLILLGFIFAIAFFAFDRLRGRTLQLGKA